VDTVRTTAGQKVEIGPLAPGELEDLFELFAEEVAGGRGYPHRAPLTREAFAATWTGPETAVIAARVETGLVGAYYLRPNFPGRAGHIANAGYVVAVRWRGQGIGRALIEDSILRAPALGFDAIQFNLVFASNPSRALYEKLGWRQIGTVPRAVDDEDAIIYWRAV